MKSVGITLLLVIGAAALVGCKESDQSVTSPEYAKLPPGEGERRLKETLAKHNGIKTGTPPASGTTGK